MKKLALAIGALLAATQSASADPVSIFLLAQVGITAAAGSTIVAITTFALSVTAAVGLSYLAAALKPKPKQEEISSQPGGTTGKLQSGGTIPRAFGIGRYMTAGSLVYANTYNYAMASAAAIVVGKTARATGNTPNSFLVQVIALSDLPVNGLVSLFVNNSEVVWDTETTEKFEGYVISEYNEAGYEVMWVRFYDGTQTVADPALVALFGTDPDRPYGADRIGTGVAYAIVTTIYGSAKFSGFPQFKFVLDGISMYDRRYDSGAGGSGTQVLATPSTWEVTSNPIVAIENVLRGIYYDGKWVYGAQTVSSAQLPSASFTAGASECDVAIDLDGGGTEPQFAVGGEVRFNTEPAETIEELLKACNGRLAEIGGKYKVRAGASGSAVFSFSDSDILSTEQQTFEPFPSLGQTINAVTAKYVSPAEGWVPKDAPPLYDATLEAEDGGRRQPVDVSYSFVNSGTQVQRLMKAERDDHRAMRRHALPMPTDAFVLEPLDVVSWTSTRNGYTTKLFDVTSADDLPNLNMGLALKEIDPAAYDWTPATDEQPVTDNPIVIITTPSQPMVDWNAVPWTIESDDDRELPGIKLSWDPNTVDVDGVRFEIRIAATAEVIHRGETDSIAAGSIIISQNLISNTAYEARGQYRPISVRNVTWSSWLPVTTPDIRIVSSDLSAALQAALAEAAIASDNAIEALRALADRTIESVFEQAVGEAAILAILAGQENKSAFQRNLIQTRSDIQVLLDTETAARVTATDAISAQIDDPTTGLSSRASSVDVVAIQAFLDDPTYGTSATASAISALQATVNNGSTGVVATYANVVTLQTLTGHATQGNVALASRATILEAAVNDGTTGLITRASASDLTALKAGTDGSVLATRVSNVSAISTGQPVTVTISIASPGVITWYGHGLIAGLRVMFSTTGTLPTGLTAGTYYYVISAGLTADTFRVSATLGGSAINTSVSQSGVHTAVCVDVSAGGMFRTVASIGSGGATSVVDLQVSASVGAVFSSAGLQMAAFVNSFGTAYSRLRFYSDLLEVGSPGVTGGDYVAIYSVQTVNSVPRIAIVPDMIADSSIGARALATGVAAGTVTVITGSDVTHSMDTWYNSGSGTTVISTNVTVGEGSALIIDFFSVALSSNSSVYMNQQRFRVRVYNNGAWTTWRDFVFDPPNYAGTTGTWWFHYVPYTIAGVVARDLVAGPATVEVLFFSTVSITNIDITWQAPTLTIQEMLKANVVTGTAPTTAVTYQATTVGGTSGTFNSAAIGSADVNRVVVVGLCFYHDYNPSISMTINGIAAKFIGYTSQSSQWVALFVLRVPTGTTANIVANVSGTFTGMSISVWKVVASSELPIAWSRAYANNAGSTMSVVSGDVLIAFASGDSATTGFSYSWGGSDTATEQVDAMTSGQTPESRRAAYDMTLTQTTSQAFTVTAASSTRMATIAAVFR